MTESLEVKVRAVVTQCLTRGQPFTPQQIARALEPELGALPVGRVAKVIRKLFDEGLLRPFGYRRTLRQERTRQGVVTAVLYAPPRSAVSTVGSEQPTRAPAARSLGYLGLSAADRRRVDRQTRALERQLAHVAEDVIRAGEILQGARALLGPRAFTRYVERELRMSADTARRLIRAARILADHPRLDRLAVIKPTLLYKLSERSFPSDLREAILRDGGLTVGGSLRPLESLRVRDLEDAKRRQLARAEGRSTEASSDPALEGLVSQALARAPRADRQAQIAVLQRLLERLEKEK